MVTIKPPLQIVDVGNGCEALSAHIYIPAKSKLTATLHSTTRSMFFLDYNFHYSNTSKYIIWFGYSFTKLSQSEIEKLCSKMAMLPPMNMVLFQRELNAIDENCPLSIPPSAIITIQIVTAITLFMTITIAIWQVCKRKKNVSSLFQVAPEIKDLIASDLGGLLNSIKSLLSNSSKPVNDEEASTQEPVNAVCTSTTLGTSSVVPVLPPHNQVPTLPMLMPSPDFLTPDVVEKLFQVYQCLPVQDSCRYKKYLEWQSPIPTDSYGDQSSSSC